MPSFHDAEVVSLSLHRLSPSTLSIHVWNMTNEVDDRGYYVLDKHAVVTFTLEGLIDLELEGFNQQNVIHRLHLGRAPTRPERTPYYIGDLSPDDYEIELEPCYGLNGRIRCRRVSVSFVPGRPDDLR
jgi:hypothetical protein